MSYCCETFERHATYKCSELEHSYNRFLCPDVIIAYLHERGQWVIPIHDGSNSGVIIRFCPWCGKEPYDRTKEKRKKPSRGKRNRRVDIDGRFKKIKKVTPRKK